MSKGQYVDVFITYNNLLKRQCILFVAAMMSIFLTSLCVYSQSSEKQDDAAQNDPVHIVSDQMVVDTIKRIVDFNGNIRMTSRDSVITADHLKVYYKEGGFTGGTDTESSGEEPSSEESIDKIIAIGNVGINFDNRVAVAEHAVYTTANGILVLTGKEAKITSDNNTISGEKITLHRRDGRVFVESSSKERVRAVLENKKKDSVSTD